MSRTNKFWIWLSIFILATVFDIVLDPQWRSLGYFILNIAEMVSMICCFVYFPKGKQH